MTASVNKERRKVREKIKITKAFDKSSAKSIKIQSCRQERYNLPTLYTVMTEEKKIKLNFLACLLTRIRKDDGAVDWTFSVKAKK